MATSPALERSASPSGRWLRERRLKVALWIAVAEGILVVVGAVPVWAALVAGGLVVAFWFVAGHRLGSPLAREASWTAAVSQALVALVPLLTLVVTALAVVALALIAAAALVALLAERR